MGTAGTTALDTYGALSGSPGPVVTVTVPPSGKVLVSVTSGVQSTTGSASCGMSFTVNGLASDTRAVILLGNNFQQASASFVVTVPPGPITFTALYRRVGGAGTCTFSNRSMWVIPLP